MTSGALRRWRDEEGDLRVLGLVRLAIGVLLLFDAVRAARELAAGYFGDAFHWPIVPDALVPSASVYLGLVGARIVLALLVVCGVRAREALLASALLGTYVLFCDRLEYHNNRWALFAYSTLLALSPCDRAFRLGAAPGPRTGLLWAVRLAQLQVSIVYAASGGSKLLDPDWRGGRVLMERLHLFGSQALAAGVPAAFVAWLERPEVAGALSALAIGTEIFLAVGLWSRRTRVVALWCGVWFHLSIEATSRVEGFTWLTLAMYALFVTPDVRSRRASFDPASPWGRAAARTLRALDWFLRFEIASGPPGTGVFAVQRRDGTRVTGLGALAMAARCTPLLFPLWAPLAVVARASGGRRGPDEGRSAGAMVP
jgi:hypothetical protein